MFGSVVNATYIRIMKEETQSVRISKGTVQELKINAATYGGTIRGLLERGAGFAMGENVVKNKKRKSKSK